MSKTLLATYDSPVDVETVFAALSGPQWAPRKAEQLHDSSTPVGREVAADGGVQLAVSRALPDGVPGFLTRFLPRDGRVVQTDTWGPDQVGIRRGTWRADLPGAPATIGGTMRLEPIATGTRYTIEGEVTVTIPLVGGKAESFVVDMILKLTARENDVLQEMVR